MDTTPKKRAGRPKTSTPVYVEDCSVVSIKDIPKPISFTELVEISRSCNTCGHVERTSVSVIKTRQGPRFLCICRLRVMKLYQPKGSNEWRCRECFGLVYRDQYEKPSERLETLREIFDL